MLHIAIFEGKWVCRSGVWNDGELIDAVRAEVFSVARRRGYRNE